MRPEVREDPALLAWLEEMFTRRGAPMPNANRKQAWLIDGARRCTTRTGRRRDGGSSGPTDGS